MGQIEVLEILEKCKKPLSRSEIAKELCGNVCQVSHAIARLIKGKEIKVMEIDRDQAMRIYHCKRRMRLYYL